MIYEKKYPITHSRGEYLVLEWERGYKNTCLYYNDRLVGKIDSIQKLKKGAQLNDEELGLIQLKFSDKPISVDIIVNGLHCENNVSHPAKKIKSISNYFYMFAVFALIGSILAYVLYPYNEILILLAIVDLPFIILYVLCAVYAAKGKAWPVYTGFIVFCFFTLITIFNFFVPSSVFGPIGALGSLIFRVTFIVLMAPYLKMAFEIPKYRKYQVQSDNNLIDNI